MQLTFEWDEGKAKQNYRKHKVSFEEAKTIFNDPFLITFTDPNHSESESRYLSIGYSSKGRVLVVVHTDRSENIRLISSRSATKNERNAYEKSKF